MSAASHFLPPGGLETALAFGAMIRWALLAGRRSPTTFSAIAELAGSSRVLGCYHLQVDNLEGLALGRKVVGVSGAKTTALFAGRTK